MAASKTQKICILGANETVGSVEALLGLDCYLQTAVASADCELMVLKKTQFERAFKRKTAASTLDKLKDILGNKLCLYIYQSDPSSVSFLKYLNIKLMDPHVVHEIKKNKQRKGKHDEAYIGAEKMTKSIDEQEIVNLLKKLHMNTDSATELPPEDMTEMALAKLDRRMRIWSENSNMNGSRLAELKSSSICLSDNRDVSH